MVSWPSSRFYAERSGEGRRGEERPSSAGEQPQKKTEPDDYLGLRTKDTVERGVDGHPYRSIRGPGYIPTYGAPGSGAPAKLLRPKLKPLVTSYELSVAGPPVLHN